MAAMWGLLLAMGVPTALPSSKAGLLVANSEELPRCLVPKLAAIRDRALSAGTCRVVLMTRVREPLAYYLSFWRWAIMGRQLTDRECREKHALGKHAGARVLPETACPDRFYLCMIN
ncbi:hypothetical protein T492DRAFT_1045634 [Pavlovales sp. CCMP2436]|nr:hypothetical protein T492DRAFT_1045634 [Pavlovales sp. CCMP2436]